MHFPELVNLSARAWHEVKDAADPEFNQCDVTHRERLIAQADAIVKLGLRPIESDLTTTPFDHAVARIHAEDQEKKSKADQILAENPKLHADEVMHIASGAPHPLGHAEDRQRAAIREEFHPAHDELVSIAADEAAQVALGKSANSVTDRIKKKVAPKKPAAKKAAKK